MKIKHLSILISRIALFIIYFWFGFLKVIGQSPASTMVHTLFDKTMAHMMPFISFGIFIVLFGLFEMLIGLLFILPGWERWALSLFAFHMVTTILPIFVMSEVWTHFMVPTLEGQYIIKNIALIACALSIWSTITPLKSKVPDPLLTQ